MLRKVAYTDLKIFGDRYDGNVEAIGEDLLKSYGKKKIVPVETDTTAQGKGKNADAAKKVTGKRKSPEKGEGVDAVDKSEKK